MIGGCSSQCSSKRKTCITSSLLVPGIITSLPQLSSPRWSQGGPQSRSESRGEFRIPHLGTNYTQCTSGKNPQWRRSSERENGRREVSMVLLLPRMYCHHWRKRKYFFQENECFTCKSFACCVKEWCVEPRTSCFISISTLSFWSLMPIIRENTWQFHW